MSRVVYANTPATADQETLRRRRRAPRAGGRRRGRRQRAARGVYGFTYSPGLPNAPLFAERRFRSYETHKLADGEVFVDGFRRCRDGGARSSSARRETIDPPEPERKPSVLVKVPYSRIRHRQHAAPNQDGFTMTLEPLRRTLEHRPVPSTRSTGRSGSLSHSDHDPAKSCAPADPRAPSPAGCGTR